MVAKKIQQIFAKVPEVKYGYTDISYSSFSEEYRFALVFAVPYEEQLNLDSYTEERFENSILNARNKLEIILKDIEIVLKEECIKYYIPPVAQQNEEDLLAVFSFKYAAVNAGLGWIGKNDVLITEKYGPRVRLSAVLVDYPFETGRKITESRCGSCNRCVDICPHKALKGLNWDINALRNNLIDYHLCNQKRSAYIEKHGRKNACGLCMVVCPFGMGETI
ncbi:MAG: epoxyqueuosine reductase [Lachnospiraceae bacterium]|nr:epoxyqueuosine reductase [Lachnospiraceae bacterium]